MPAPERGALVNFLTELRSDVPEKPLDDFMFASARCFERDGARGGFDPDQVVDVTAVRTERTMVFLLARPRARFDFGALPHAAVTGPTPLRWRGTRGQRPAPGGFGLLIAAGRGRDDHSERGNE